jgi:hypothetical protein
VLSSNPTDPEPPNFLVPHLEASSHRSHTSGTGENNEAALNVAAIYNGCPCPRLPPAVGNGHGASSPAIVGFGNAAVPPGPIGNIIRAWRLSQE